MVMVPVFSHRGVAALLKGPNPVCLVTPASYGTRSARQVSRLRSAMVAQAQDSRQRLRACRIEEASVMSQETSGK